MLDEEEMMDKFKALFFEYMKEAQVVRQDLISVGAWDLDDSDPLERSIKLFWEVIQPTSHSLSDDRIETYQVPSLPNEVEHALLGALTELEQRNRVGYIPDEDSSARLTDRIVYIHIAAARALRLKLTQGYTDEMTQSLSSAFKAAKQLGLEPPSVYGDEAPSEIISVWAATGMVLKELFFVHKLGREYERALHCLALAIWYLGAALSSAEYLAEQEPAESEGEETERLLAVDLRDRMLPYRVREQRALISLMGRRQPVFDVTPSEAAEAFHLLRNSRTREAEWKQLAQDCEILCIHWGVCLGYEEFGLEETVTDPNGKERVWRELWNSHQHWAQAQMEPNELRDEYRALIRAQEDEQAERRLTTYFMKVGNWNLIPDRARESLVSADRELFSSGRSRFESVLNELRIAAESLCYEFIWEPLSNSNSNNEILQFAERVKLMAGRSPVATHYAQLLEEPFFKQILTKTNLTEKERTFLTHELKSALRRLVPSRNIAEHAPKKDWRRSDVEECFRTFLGIGRTGILPRFAEIGLKLKGTQLG